jgi:hypothetical protein
MVMDAFGDLFADGEGRRLRAVAFADPGGPRRWGLADQVTAPNASA